MGQIIVLNDHQREAVRPVEIHPVEDDELSQAANARGNIDMAIRQLTEAIKRCDDVYRALKLGGVQAELIPMRHRMDLIIKEITSDGHK